MSAPISESNPAFPGALTEEGYRDRAARLEAAMQSLVRPGSGHISCADTLATALGFPSAYITELRSTPSGREGPRLLALRYLVSNGAVWKEFFSWERSLSKFSPSLVPLARQLQERIEALRVAFSDGRAAALDILSIPLNEVARSVEDPQSDEALLLLLALDHDAELRQRFAARFRQEAPELLAEDPAKVDTLAVLAQDLSRLPATTVAGGQLEYVIVADKGEMGVRAAHEAVDFGAVPVVVFNENDDKNALQVRIAEENGGFSIPLSGSFRETYANPLQIAERVVAEYGRRFGDESREKLRRSAVYPGYGPLAENTAAIEVFRRHGIAFIGPMQDVVERAGDKRKFRLLAQSIDPGAVTPGIVMVESDAQVIIAAVQRGEAEKRFVLPGRLKAANGGGGRGQAVIQTIDQIASAVTKVLSEIKANGWDQGVMFEQNIFETTHLEVQIVRDRFGNTRHFGMRDCTEQRASQKIQEEAPPAILRDKPELQQKMCDIAVRIADEVGYVGACTVELMYKDGHFYLLEMNTRIQVEHPVTEEAHRILRNGELWPLNLVQLQFQVASGRALDFAQSDVRQTHVAREFRINAESYKPEIKDPRDGKLGLFLPNAGVFDEIFVPEADTVREALEAQGLRGVGELTVRFDCGFEEGDDLVNKDPTFGKLIVALSPQEGEEIRAFELLRRASIEVLKRTNIVGRQLLPNGKVLEDRPLETNVEDHISVLQTEMLQAHSQGGAPGRHVNWLIEHLRAAHSKMAASP